MVMEDCPHVDCALRHAALAWYAVMPPLLGNDAESGWLRVDLGITAIHGRRTHRTGHMGPHPWRPMSA